MDCRWGSSVAENLCGKASWHTRARLLIAMSCNPHYSEPTILRNVKAREALRCQVRTTFIRSLIMNNHAFEYFIKNRREMFIVGY